MVNVFYLFFLIIYGVVCSIRMCNCWFQQTTEHESLVYVQHTLFMTMLLDKVVLGEAMAHTVYIIHFIFIYHTLIFGKGYGLWSIYSGLERQHIKHSHKTYCYILISALLYNLQNIIYWDVKGFMLIGCCYGNKRAMSHYAGYHRKKLKYCWIVRNSEVYVNMWEDKGWV